MTNKEAIRILGLECDEWDVSHCTASERREAFEMAITALENNSNEQLNNSTATQFNGIESKVKGLTACRVPEDDCISRREAIDAIENAKNDNLTTESAQNVPNQAFKMQKSDAFGAKTGETCSDTISRQAAIDALDTGLWGVEWDKALATTMLKDLPSVQPVAKDTNVLNNDTISRAEAIDVAFDIFPDDEYFLEQFVKSIEALPSVQPEIIRCRDCRWRKDQSGSTAWLPCRAIATPSDFYCGRAERRTDERTD